MWGSPRIVAELHKPGIEVAKSTVKKYKPHGDRSPAATWRTFLDLHLKDLVAIDFFVVPTARFKVLFVFVVLSQIWGSLRVDLNQAAGMGPACVKTQWFFGDMGRFNTGWLLWRILLILHSTSVIGLLEFSIIFPTEFLALGFLHSLGQQQPVRSVSAQRLLRDANQSFNERLSGSCILNVRFFCKPSLRSQNQRDREGQKSASCGHLQINSDAPSD